MSFGGGFGNKPLFGSTATPFGGANTSNNAFGASQNAGFGGMGGGVSGGLSSSNPFGTPSNMGFGASGTLGSGDNNKPGGLFGTPQQPSSGTLGGGGLFGSTNTGSSLFGGGSTGFGAPQQPQQPFGGVSSGGAFGQTQSSLFGSNNSSSLFGGPKPAFGTPGGSSAFGGATTSGFGAGSSLGGFGQPQSSSLFGGPSNTGGGSLFGGGASNTFGGGTQQSSLFGNQNTGFSASSSGGLFGASTAGPTTGLFGGGASNTGTFGAASSAFGMQQQAKGTTAAKYQVTTEMDSSNGSSLKFQSISMMSQYRDKSVEELRMEDYAAGVKGANAQIGGFGSPASGGLFGSQQPAAGGSLFGSNPASSSSLFGGGGTTGGGLFGNTSNNTFGGGGGGLFGGAQQSAPAFGQSAPAFGGSTFGAPQQSSGGLFGTQQSGVGLFGSTTGGGGGLFGSSTPSLGTSTGVGLFGASTSSFGNPATGGLFGAKPPTMPSMSGGGFSFGNSAPQQTGGFSFGSQPSFNFSSSPQQSGSGLFGSTGSTGFNFGAQPQSSSSLFGGGSNLFGSTTNNAAKPFQLGLTSSPSSGPGLFGASGSGGLFGGTGTTNTQGGLNFGVPSTGFGHSTFNFSSASSLFGGPQANFNPQSQQAPPLQANISSNPYGNSPLFASVSIGTMPQISASQGIGSKDQKSDQSKNPLLFRAPPSNTSRLPIKTPAKHAKPNVSGSHLTTSLFKSSNTGATFSDDAFGNSLASDTKSRIFQQHFLKENRSPIKKLVIEPEAEIEKRRDSTKNAAAALNASASNTSPATASGHQAGRNFGERDKNSFSDTPQTDKLLSGRSFHKRNAGTQLGSATKPSAENGDVLSVKSKPGSSPGFSFAEKTSEQVPTSQSQQTENVVVHDIQFRSRSTPSKPQSHPLSFSDDTYYSRPTLSKLQNMNQEGLSSVKDFTIGRKGCGEIYWPGHTDLRAVNFDRDVIIGVKEVMVYPDEDYKPVQGEGLNKPAVVSLEKIWKIEKESGKILTDSQAVSKFVRKLRSHCDKNGLIFLDYDPQDGTWKFEVPHF